MSRDRIPLYLLAAIGLSVLAAPALGAQASPGNAAFALPSADLPVFEPSRAAQDIASQSEPLSPSAFVEAALTFSLLDPAGPRVPGAELQAARATWEAFVRSRLPALEAIGSEYERGEAVLKSLHSGLFKRYRATQSRLDALISGGDYNCVSSSVAFAALAKAAGLRVAAVKTVDHALCVIILEDGRRVDVETTNPYGFDPGTKKEVFSESFGRSTGFAYVPPSQYADRSEIGEKELLALILSNRIGELESAGRFREALVLALDYAVLAPGPAGRSLLGERLSNAAIGLSNSGKRLEALALIQAAETALGPFPEAAQARTGAVRGAVADYQRRGDYQGGFAFIAFARDAYGEDDVFMEFERVYVNNHALALIKAGSYEEALAFLTLDSSLAAMGRERIGALRENAALAWLSAWMGSRSFADQLGLARRIRDSGWVGETRLSEALQAVCGREASRLAAADPARGWLDSAAAFGLGLEILPVDSDLERGRKTCLDNHESVILNKSAALFNAGKRSEARQILRDALVELPGSARLVKRLADMEKAGD